MFEFCENCGGILLPSKKNDNNILTCKSCGQEIPFERELIKSYIFNTEIDHPQEEKFDDIPIYDDKL
jgi:DNA-directed RNA polymerase subunit M/transcription elongation factor TFIIS